MNGHKENAESERLPYDIFNISANIKDVSRNPKSLLCCCEEEKIEGFRKLVLANKKLISRTDDIFLLSFLRARKFDQEKALQLLKNYYDVRKRYPEIYKNLNPSKERNCIDSKLGGYLPTTDQNGSIIAIARSKHWDTTIIGPKDIIRNVLLHADLLLSDHLVQIYGMTVIFDAEGFSWRHLLQLTPRVLYIAICSLYGCYPLRYKGIHFVNTNRFMNYALSILFPVLPRKLKERIHLHPSGVESLHKFIPSEYLCSDYGGNLPVFDPSECNELLIKHEDFFRECEKYWTVEKTRSVAKK